MNIYKVDIKKGNMGYSAELKEFDIGCTADTIDKAVSTLYGEVLKKGVMIIKSGKSIPESSEVEENSLYITVDFERALRESFSTETSRRNITLPTWMDYKLRLYGVDASRLFQEAAEKFIKEYESF